MGGNVQSAMSGYGLLPMVYKVPLISITVSRFASQICFNPFPNNKFQTLPNSKSSKFDRNGTRVENTVGKKEIA